MRFTHFMLILWNIVIVYPFKNYYYSPRFLKEASNCKDDKEILRVYQGDNIRDSPFRLFSSLDRSYNNIMQDNSDDGSDFVLDDFDYLLDGIYIFKKVYGDFDISAKFEVPAEDPWPPHLHGLRLGKRLEKLFSSQQFFQQYPDKVEEIRKLGLEPNLKSLIDDWEAIIRAMKTYKSLYGDVRVNSKFIVPNTDNWPRVSRGLKLGVRIAAIRSAGRYVKGHPDRKEALDELGFEWRLRATANSVSFGGEDVFDNIYDALVVYKTLYNDVAVPSDFVVPSESPWKQQLHGLALGQYVVAIREKDKLVFGQPEREQKLTELGFVWDDSSRLMYSKRRFELIYEALVVYKEKFGNLFVPQSFIVAEDASWPESTWGLKLGARVNAIRSQGTLVANYPERRVLLEELGFTWELPLHIKRRKKAVVGSAEEEDEEATWGELDELPYDTTMPARTADSATDTSRSGAQVPPAEKKTEYAKWETEPRASDDLLPSQNRIRSMTLPGRMGGGIKDTMSYDPSRMFQPIAYRELAAETIREHMQGREYSSDPDVRQWAHFEGELTVEEYHRVITRAIPDADVAMMKSTGYKILEFGRFNWDVVESALAIYHAYHGHINVPHSFVVNYTVIQSDMGFPESLEDLQLGEIVAGIRIGDIDGFEDPDRRAFLDGLGFDWGDLSQHLRFRFVPLVLGLKVYKHLYGFALPQHDFVIPDEPQWPYWMNGMPLGLWASIARVQQALIESHYPQRRDMFTALEFLWWVPPGPIPSKYFEPLTLSTKPS